VQDGTRDAARLYQDTILGRARAPRHAGRLDGPAGQAENRACGDEVVFSLRVEAGRIAEARHETRGCAICQASADAIAGLAVGAAASAEGLKQGRFGALWEEARAALDGTPPEALDGAAAGDEAAGLLEIFAGMAAYRARHRCATLPRQALERAVETASAGMMEQDGDTGR